MEIALAADDRYALALGVCIASIYENNKGNDVNIHILTQGFSQSNIKRLGQVATRYDRKLDIIEIDADDIRSLKTSERFSLPVYFRMLLPSLLEVNKILYLDCDIIINGDLTPLWNIPVDGFAAAVVEDQCADDIRIHNRIRSDGRYFNSGVMLMNLDYWRRNATAGKCISYLRQYPERCVYPDQDAMNAVLSSELKFIDFQFNAQSLLFDRNEDRFLHYSKWPEVDAAVQDPLVIHYTHRVKPWHSECSHPMLDKFDYYCALTPWAGFKKKRYYGFLETMDMKIHKLTRILFH